MGKTRLRPAAKGFSTLEMNGGRLVEVERDSEVMRIKREIERRWPELEVYEDLENKEFVVIHHAPDGTEYVAAKARTLTQSIIDVIAKADQASAGYVDFMAEIEKGWEQQERAAEWLSKHRGPVVLSNQATPRIVKLYRSLNFSLRFLEAPRRISCTGDRTPAPEVLATRNLK